MKPSRAPSGVAGQQAWTLPGPLDAAVRETLDDWTAGGRVGRLWARDATLWTGADEGSWLGWLGIAGDQIAHIDRLVRAAEDVKRGGFHHVLLLGMGGSSLCPEVLKMTFGTIGGAPELHVLDSTDPAQIRAAEGRVDLGQTLFIVSSKSGRTLEPNIYKQYFFDRIRAMVGPTQAGRRFIAITDPGSELSQVAEADRFRHIFFGLPSIGGRYSALSDFGMVPAAIMGLDVGRLLGRAGEMATSCAAGVPVADNPGVVLGTIIGVLATNGRDKVTLIASPGIHDLGAWLEQLLAESTGKEGKGVIPVDREPLGDPAAYGGDRLFIYLRLAAAPDMRQDEQVAALERAGQPVVRITLPDPYDLGAEFFRWEFATAVASSILGINAFNQPDVEASKVATRRLTEQYEETGSLPAETALVEANGIRLFADDRNAAELSDAVAGDRSLDGMLRAHLARIKPGDYAALLAYIEMNDANEGALQAIRRALRDRYQVATCLGFGPRFLHSTGQAYKGGPNTGVFLQITCDDAADLPVPGQKYTFGVVKAAQARGDLQVLAERGRRALRVHLGRDVSAGLAALRRAIEQWEGRRILAVPGGGLETEGAMILAGDIGGTHTRLAFFEIEGGAPRPGASATYASREHGSLDDIVARFVAKEERQVDHACFGIAGPIRNGRCETTNLAWVVDSRTLADKLAIPTVSLINDLEATAHGIAALGLEDVVELNPGGPDATGNMAVVAAGTGLGEAGLAWDGRQHHPFASEGGHADFAPQDELQIELLGFLMKEFGHVSVERVLSGPGLHNIYRFLRDAKGGHEPAWLAQEMRDRGGPAAISKAGLENRSSLCARALELFVAIYGAEAGNFALKVMATGGVYIGGGIAPQILEKLREPIFMEAFVAKGRLRSLMEAMPVRVIRNDRTALLGAARCAALRASLI